MDSDEGSRRPGRRRKEDVEDFAGGKKRGRPKKNDMEVYDGRDT
jgi:ATP-dependent helicase STH1/SNF2